MDHETREKLTDLLKVEEGLRLQAYDDHTGLIIKPKEWVHLSGIGPSGVDARRLIGSVTIGHGRNLHGKGISNTEANLLLRSDIIDVVVELDQAVPWWATLDPVRQIVIADMAFNMGTQNLIDGWPNFMQHVKLKHFDAAATLMDGSLWHRQVRTRADRLIGMMRTGKLPK